MYTDVPFEVTIERNIRAIMSKHVAAKDASIPVLKSEIARYLRDLFSRNVISEYECQLDKTIPYVTFTLANSPHVSYRVILGGLLKTD